MARPEIFCQYEITPTYETPSDYGLKTWLEALARSVAEADWPIED